MLSEPNKGHEAVDCKHVSHGAVPKTSANAFRSCPSKLENAKSFKISDGPKSLDSTNTNERVNVFDFSSLDLGKSMFASEDHTQILMQADNLLQATKHQLLDLQMTMPFEGKQFRAENRLSESSLSSDDNINPGGDLTPDAVQGTQPDSKIHVQSGPLSSSKQKNPKVIYPKEFVNKKSIPVQNKARKMPRNFTEQQHITNNHPSNTDILNEIHITQASLQGGLSTAKGVSAHLEVRAGREGKKIQFRKSGLESGKPSRTKLKKSQCAIPAQIDNGIHLTSVPGGVSQSLANDQIVDITNDADIPKFSLNSEHSYVGTPIPSDVRVCTNQSSKSQLQNAHSQTDVESQVKGRQRKLISEDSATFRNTDTEVLKYSSQNDNISSHHTNVCNCGVSKVPTNLCNSAVIHLKDSFPSEENVGSGGPQLGTRLVVQALPSLSIKRNLSVQKAPSVSIPPPDAPPYVPPRQNIGLCKMSHSNTLLDLCDCTSKSCDHKKRTDKNVSKAERRLLEETKKHAHQKHGSYKGSRASSELDRRDRVAKERAHKDLVFQTVPTVGLRSGKCNECEGYFLTDEMKGVHCITCYNKCRSILKLPAENESHKTKPHRHSSGSLMKQLLTEECQFLCKRCRNNFPLRDLYYGVCGKCYNIPSSVHDANQLMYGSASDAVKAAAHLTQCSSCLRHFPQSELFYGHCIHCQIAKKEMRLLQCKVCLNSVISTEYSNGTCNQCRDKFKSDTQEDKLYAYPSCQGPAKERILNTVLDGTPIFFDITKAQCLNKSPSTIENTSVQNKKENCCPLPEPDEKRETCSVQGTTTVETTGFVADDTTRKNRGINPKVNFEIGEYLNDNENKSIKKPLEVPKQNEKKAVKLQEVQSEKVESRDYHKPFAMIRTADECRTTLYSGTKDREHLSFHAQNSDKEDTSSDSNGCSHMKDQDTYGSVNNDDGGDATNDNSGYEQDVESGNKSTDIEVEVSEDNGGYSRIYPSASKLQETQAHIHNVAAVQTAAENLVKENRKWVHTEYGSGLRIINTVLHHHLGTCNGSESESDPDELPQPVSKKHEPGEKTDESSSRNYSDKYDDASESISDTNIRAKIGSRDESLDHGSISKNASTKSRQHHKYLFDDHSESLWAADKSKYSTSKLKQHATAIKKVSYSHCNWQHGTESHFDTSVVDDSTRYSTREYPRHCLDDNYNRRKPLQAQKVASINKQKQSPGTAAVSKKSSGCRMNSKDDNGEEKHHGVTVTRIEEELLKDMLEQAGEGNDKNMSPVPSVSSTAEPMDGETSLADNTSVNENDYVYEDDWEEEPEEKDSEVERKLTDDESQQSKQIPHVSGTDSEDIARSDNEAALSLQPPELLQERPCHSPCTKTTNPQINPPTETSEKTTPHRAVPQTPPVCPVKASNEEYYQKFLYVDHETSSLNSLPFKSVDKGSSPIDILTENPVGRGTSSNDPVEHIRKASSSVSIPEKTYVDRDSSPVNIPSAIIVPSEKSVNKSTSPVIFLSPKHAVPPCNDNCTDTNIYGVQVANSLHGIALYKAEVARSITNMQSTRQQTTLPEQSGTIGGASKIHPEGQCSSEDKVEALDTVLPAHSVKRIDTETQTDTVAELTGLHGDKKEKIKEKKQRWLACGQSQLHDEPSSSSFRWQELLPVQQEVVPYSSASSRTLANTTEMTCKTPSVSSGQISPSDDEQLVSYRSCSVGEFCVSSVPEERSCSCHTGSHSMGEVWNCHCCETHCLCSEGEIVVDGTQHRGQHVSRNQHTSRTQIGDGIIIHSNMPIQDDFDPSEGTNNYLPSIGAAAMDAAVQHPSRSQGPCDQSCAECNSRSEGELSEGQVITWQQ